MEDGKCAVGIIEDNGKVKYIYIESEGWPEFTGVFLLTEYSNLKRVKDLINSGCREYIDLYSDINPMNAISRVQYSCELDEFLDRKSDLDEEDESYRYLFDPENKKWIGIDCYIDELKENKEDAEFMKDYMNCVDEEGFIDLYLLQKTINRINADLIISALGSRSVETYMYFDSYIDMKCYWFKNKGSVN